LTLELNGTPEWSQASIEQSNVVPMCKPVKRAAVTQGNLLRFNSIKVSRQRPLSPWRNENEFRAYCAS